MMGGELNFNDDTFFDRLADGELSVGERRELLLSLDGQPDGWRRCALAFLEAQSWHEGLNSIVCPAEQVTLAARADASDVRAFRRNRQAYGRWLALAASLLIAFTIGLVLHDNIFTNHNGLPLADGPFATVTQPPESALRPVAPTKDALTLWVRDDKGQTQPLRVPLVDADAVDRQLGLEFQTGLPADMRSHLKQKGYDVQSKQRYAPMWLDNGRPLVVPVEDTKIVPVSQRVY